MRWIWIDRIVEFQSGIRARAVKNVTLSEDHLHDHFPGFPVMPGSLIMEGMAQTGGILLGESSGFSHMVVLAKIPKLIFHSWAVPGDTLTYTANLLDAREGGGIVEATAHVGERLLAEAEIVFAHLDKTEDHIGKENSFGFTMRLLGVFEVGRAGDGGKLESSIPSTFPGGP